MAKRLIYSPKDFFSCGDTGKVLETNIKMKNCRNLFALQKVVLKMLQFLEYKNSGNEKPKQGGFFLNTIGRRSFYLILFSCLCK